MGQYHTAYVMLEFADESKDVLLVFKPHYLDGLAKFVEICTNPYGVIRHFYPRLIYGFLTGAERVTEALLDEPLRPSQIRIGIWGIYAGEDDIPAEVSQKYGLRPEPGLHDLCLDPQKAYIFHVSSTPRPTSTDNHTWKTAKKVSLDAERFRRLDQVLPKYGDVRGFVVCQMPDRTEYIRMNNGLLSLLSLMTLLGGSADERGGGDLKPFLLVDSRNIVEVASELSKFIVKYGFYIHNRWEKYPRYRLIGRWAGHVLRVQDKKPEGTDLTRALLDIVRYSFPVTENRLAFDRILSPRPESPPPIIRSKNALMVHHSYYDINGFERDLPSWLPVLVITADRDWKNIQPVLIADGSPIVLGV